MRIHSSDDEEEAIMDLSQALDRAEDTDLNQPLTKESPMATKKSAAPAAAEAAPKPTKKTKTAAPAAEKPAAKEDTGGPRAVPEGYVGLHEIADQLGTSTAACRRKLRGQDKVSRPEGQRGWFFKKDSKELKAVMEICKPAAEEAGE